MFVSIVYSLIGLAVFIVFVVACIKKKIWIASLMLIIYCCGFLLRTALRIELGIGLSDSYIIEGGISPFPLIPIGVVLSLIGVGVILFRKRRNQPPAHNPSRIRWLWLSFGTLILISGHMCFLSCVYIIDTSGSIASVSYGVYIDLITSFIGSFVLYLASKLNSIQRPNLMRWIVFYICISFVNALMTSINILGRPVFFAPEALKPETAFISLSMLLAIGFIPPSALILSLTKDFVTQERK